MQSVEESPKEDSENVIDEDYLRNADWIGKEKHVFVLSSAGKPIYSR